MKRMGFDSPALERAGAGVRRQHKAMIKRWSALLVPSEYFVETFVKSYGYQGRLVRKGLPRNDLLVTGVDDSWAKAKKAELGLPADRRLVLYCPTFRDRARRLETPYQLPLDLEADAPRPGRRRAPDAAAALPGQLQADRPVRAVRHRRVAPPRRHRADAGGRRAGHRLLLGDVRLREHRQADGVLHLRLRGLRPRRARHVPRAAGRRPRPDGGHDGRADQGAGVGGRRRRDGSATSTPSSASGSAASSPGMPPPTSCKSSSPTGRSRDRRGAATGRVPGGQQPRGAGRRPAGDPQPRADAAGARAPGHRHRHPARQGPARLRRPSLPVARAQRGARAAAAGRVGLRDRLDPGSGPPAGATSPPGRQPSTGSPRSSPRRRTAWSSACRSGR